MIASICGRSIRAAAALALAVLIAMVAAQAPASAQLFGGIVFDPTNYANALARYAQLQQQYAQLVATYQQLRTEYLLLSQQAQLLPVNMAARYRSQPSVWLPLAAADTYGTTAAWILAANSGPGAVAAYTQATQPLLDYGGSMARLSAEESGRVRARYDRLQLADGTNAHALEALGYLRGHQASMELTVRNLEEDAYTSDPDRNTQVAVLNKIDAVGVTAARLAKDTNNVLVSVLEQQILEATDRREAAVQAVNAHIAFLNQAPSLLAASTAQTTAALTGFRVP
jgi:hypothetical protein